MVQPTKTDPQNRKKGGGLTLQRRSYCLVIECLALHTRYWGPPGSGCGTVKDNPCPEGLMTYGDPGHTEKQRGEATCPKPHYGLMVKLGLASPDSHPSTLSTNP